MIGVKIFVEGKADIKFVKDYLSHLGRTDVADSDFERIDSNTEIAIQKRLNEFEKSTAKGNVNLLIFDADANKITTEAELIRVRAKLAVNFEIFLFPNNADAGNLETLLEKIINPKHQPIFDCFEGYQDCLRGKSKDYKVPATKTKVYAYVDTLISKNDEKLAKEENRNYLNTDHWSLGSAALKPLKDFLEAYIR